MLGCFFRHGLPVHILNGYYFGIAMLVFYYVYVFLNVWRIYPFSSMTEQVQ